MNSTSKQIHLLDHYASLQGFSAAQMTKLQKLCGPRWIDLLFHLPTGLMDRRNTPTIAEAENGEHATILVKVLKHKKGFRRGRQRSPYKIYVEDDSAPMELIFFNYGGWLEKAFPIGEEVIVSGTVDVKLSGAQISHPDVWPAKRKIENIATMWPVYPLTAGITQNNLRRAILMALEIAKETPSWLPEDWREKYQWPSFIEALKQVHHPEKEEDILPLHSARARLAFDEIFASQIALRRARKLTRQKPGIAHFPAGDVRQRFYDALPFSLTGDQQKVITEIDGDMETAKPMLRLVQGDVGSGKTVVALAALIRAVENGYQGVMMAPTEILAQQHFDNMRKILEPLGIRIALLTGKLSAAHKKQLKKELKDGLIQIVVGTHALVQKDVEIPKCSLVVIDEQHRFGVAQRMAFNNDGRAPDLLVMTATPIPRTLALTAYGDMDLSLIKEKPPGRKPITTRAMPIERMPEIATSLQRVIDKGEQIYWVCPLIEESEKIDLAAATDRFEDLHKIYPNQVALLHGKMKSVDKEQVLEQFRDGHFKILVSTTVIEVGIDVPQATIMVIEHTERFGLAQLHQLRGRVGRGGSDSSCVLLYSSPLSNYAKERIKTLRESEDGFVLAEKDLELRGAGEILGTRQSGHLLTRLANLHQHADLIPIARKLAEQNLEETPATRYLLELFEKEESEKLLAAG